jgi:chorismate mutase / prephenate dehydratase
MSTFSLILPGRDRTSTPLRRNNQTILPKSLDLPTLRRRLDQMDDRLQDLLIERAEIVTMVAASKRDANQPAFQPAREAEIIRRLVGRHRGSFPLSTLVRMWREMLAATVRLQSPFSVAVFAPADRQGYWDLARDHYGSQTPMAAHGAVEQVIEAVAGGRASVGVLPIPEVNETDPWWPRLLSIRQRIIARLPFGAPGNACTSGDEAWAIGDGTWQESGFDRTLVAAEYSAEAARARVLQLLSARGLVCTFFARCGNAAIDLIEIDGFVPAHDPRLDSFRADLGSALRRLVPLGGYPVPLPSSAFDSEG